MIGATNQDCDMKEFLKGTKWNFSGKKSYKLATKTGANIF